MERIWEKLLRLRVVRFIADMVHVYFSKRVGRAAAELAYFLVLTFFPISICLSAFLDVLDLHMTSLVDQAAAFLPEGVTLIFREYLNYIDNNQSTALLITGAFLAILFASAAVRALMNIMDEIYGRANFRGVLQLAASVLFSVMLLATIYLSLGVVLTGNWFFHMVGQIFGLNDLVERFETWQWVKYLLLLAIVFLFLLLLYRFAAPLSKPRPPVIPGALATSAALAVASAFFSFMVSGSTQYSLVYGSLASVIILLVWLYLCGNILILGNVANYVIFCHRKERKSA